jgi:DNA-binding FadR family transcriptional regulator
MNVSRTALREAIKACDASVARATMEELLSEAVQDSRRIMDEDEENRQLITETETHG